MSPRPHPDRFADVLELERAYPDYPWHEPISMRNLLAHEYWRSDPDLVWTTLTVDAGRASRRSSCVVEAPISSPSCRDAQEVRTGHARM